MDRPGRRHKKSTIAAIFIMASNIRISLTREEASSRMTCQATTCVPEGASLSTFIL